MYLYPLSTWWLCINKLALLGLPSQYLHTAIDQRLGTMKVLERSWTFGVCTFATTCIATQSYWAAEGSGSWHNLIVLYVYYHDQTYTSSVHVYISWTDQSHCSSPEARGVECLPDNGQRSCCHTVIQCKLRIKFSCIIMQVKNSAREEKCSLGIANVAISKHCFGTMFY